MRRVSLVLVAVAVVCLVAAAAAAQFGSRVPSGSYARTCTSCRAEGSSLQCTCRDTKEARINTALDLASCEWRRDIFNKDGHLQCD